MVWLPGDQADYSEVPAARFDRHRDQGPGALGHGGRLGVGMSRVVVGYHGQPPLKGQGRYPQVKSLDLRTLVSYLVVLSHQAQTLRPLIRHPECRPFRLGSPGQLP